MIARDKQNGHTEFVIQHGRFYFLSFVFHLGPALAALSVVKRNHSSAIRAGVNFKLLFHKGGKAMLLGKKTVLYQARAVTLVIALF